MFVVGENQDSLKPVGLSLSNDGPIFMILSMTPGLGKTSSLYLWLAELSRKYDSQHLKLVLIYFHTRNLRYFSKLPHIVTLDNHLRTHVARKTDLKAILDWLKAEVNERRSKMENMYFENPEEYDKEDILRELGFILVVIDDYEAFYNSVTTEMQNLSSSIIDGEEVGVRLVLTEDHALFSNDELAKRAKKIGCGLLLGGTDGLSTFNGAQPPYGQKTTKLPPGRGYLVRRGQAQLIQAAAYWDEGQDQVQSLKVLLTNCK
jgi:hypothetical protein